MDERSSGSPDRPAIVDRLGFNLYVRRIARTIREVTERNQLPLTIGVYSTSPAYATASTRLPPDH